MKRFSKCTIVLLASAVLLVFQSMCPMKVAFGATAWNDDFESYQVGVFPSPPWTNSGNTDAFVDNTKAISGGQSLKLFGVVGGCWGALAHRTIALQPPFYVQFYVYNGAEPLSGCHSIYGAAGLSTGSSWLSSWRNLIAFDVDDRTGEKIIRGGFIGPNDPVDGINLGSYVQETWYKVRIKYEVVNSAMVRLSFWINDAFKGSYDFASFSYEADLAYLALMVGEGSAWFDDVSVSLPDISGHIEKQGQPLVGASVMIRQSDRTSQKTTTNANGDYQFDTIPAGTFRISISGTK